MHSIFFVWLGTEDDLLATGYYRGFPFGRTVPTVTNAIVGCLTALHPGQRNALTDLNPNLTVLPGMNGSLTAAQAQALNTAVPSIQSKEGGSPQAALAYVSGLFGDPEFSPNSY